jgi:hypothetical protein
MNQEERRMRAAQLHTGFVALLSLAIATSAGAQTAKSGQAPKPDQKTTTIVGCLVQGNPGAAGGERRSNSGAANANDYFVRTPTVAVPVGATVAVGKPGTTGTATSAGTPAADSYYRITGMDREQLRPHVGHRVEVQGHLGTTEPDAAAGGATRTKTTVDSAGKPTVTVETRVDVAGNLHATALKMVSASCP